MVSASCSPTAPSWWLSVLKAEGMSRTSGAAMPAPGEYTAPVSETRRFDLLLALVIVAIAAAGILPWPNDADLSGTQPPSWFLPYDDAYIHLRYAQQFVRGMPFQWSDGVPSSGETSVLFALLLAPAAAVSDDIVWLSTAGRLVGLGTLIWAAWEAARLARALRLAGPWPTVTSAAVVFGTALSVSAVAGMDAALAAACLLRLARCWADGSWATAALVAALPLVRPELGVVTVGAGLLSLTGRRGLTRVQAAVATVPLVAGAAALLAFTGDWRPAGMIGKSMFALPWVTPARLVEAYGAHFLDELLPVYFGSAPLVMVPGLGLLAIVAGFRMARAPEARALLVLWGLQLALAPFSTHLPWQAMRHHQPALALAAVIAVFGVGRFVGARWARLAAPVAASVGLAMVLASVPRARAFHAQASSRLFARAPLAAWLDAHRGEVTTLATHEAGLLSLFGVPHPIDLMGLGSPAFTRAALHREGAVLESLAREAAPTVLAVDLEVMDLAPLLVDAVVPPRERFVVGFVDGPLLARVNDGARLDFGYLPDEAKVAMRWEPPPLTNKASLAILALGADDLPSYQGCRPVTGRVGLELGVGRWVVRWTMLPDRRGTIAFAEGSELGPITTLAERADAWDGRWHEDVVTLTQPWLWVTNTDGPVCLESIRSR